MEMIKHNPIGQRSVIVALFSNTLVTIFKFIAFFFSGSAVILSEAIHSVADTANQIFLIIGISRAERPADESFNYGYKNERFFWSLLSACGIFFLGAGITVYHGVITLIRPELIEFNLWILLLLASSFIVEAFSLFTAIREIKKLAGKENLLKYSKENADPTILAVIYEDSAALTGILIAITTALLTKYTGNIVYDSIGSILVGILLGFIAISLMSINRQLLLGRAIPKTLRKQIFDILHNQKMIEEVHDFKTVMIATDGYRVKAEVEISGHYLADKIFESRDFRKEYEEIEDYNDFIRFCADFSDEITRTLGQEIDNLEKQIEKEVPGVKHIDIETN